MRSVHPVIHALVLAAATYAVRLPSPTPVRGVTFNLKMTLKTPDYNNNRLMLIRGKFADGRMRLDPSTVVGPGNELAEDEVIIKVDSGTFSLHPEQRTFARKSIETGTLVTMMRSINGGSTVTGFDIVLDSLGPGEPIDGRPTRHYRAHITYTTQPQRGAAQVTNAMYEYWLSELPVALVNPFDGRISPFGDEKARIGEILPKILGTWAKMGKGTVVRVVANTSISGQPYVRTSEITNVKEATLDDSAFTIPSDFHLAPEGRSGRGGW